MTYMEFYLAMSLGLLPQFAVAFAWSLIMKQKDFLWVFGTAITLCLTCGSLCAWNGGFRDMVAPKHIIYTVEFNKE